MHTGLYQTLPMIALAGFVATGLWVSIGGRGAQMRWAWVAPAALAFLFLAWSLFAVSREGLLGVWPEHVRNAWSNQVWFDLLLGIGSAFVLLAPRARAVGMRPGPWFVAVACTGSIGLLAMLARYLFLAERSEPAVRGQPMGSSRA
jgi:hypothetical protein